MNFTPAFFRRFKDLEPMLAAVTLGVYPVFSFQSNGFTTLLAVTALPVHIQRSYKVSFLGQESLKSLLYPQQKGKQGNDLNNSAVSAKLTNHNLPR